MTSVPSEVWLNGAFVARSEACLDIEDRAVLFGDAVYEVIRYYGGRPLALASHAARLGRSLSGMRIEAPGVSDRLGPVGRELLDRNGLVDATVYWQVSRGAGLRTHRPEPGMVPTVFAMTRPAPPLAAHDEPATTTAALVPDRRWGRCDIKSVMLAPAVLAALAAGDSGAQTAILHRGPVVTESVSANVFAVEADRLLTAPADERILSGITRGILLDVARRDGLAVDEVSFSPERLLAADEVFLCGTTSHVTAVTAVDGAAVRADGGIGPVTRRVHARLLEEIAARCGAGA